MGITGKVYNIIKNMYESDSAYVRIGNHHTNAIKVNQGVRQGCVLSPLLFNLYLSDLEQTINNSNTSPPMIDDQTRLSCLIWADDLVLLTRDKSSLQKMINTLSEYNDLNLLTLNTVKTKCMTFNKTGKRIRSFFKYKNTILEDVFQYKYLGFLLNNFGGLKSGLANLKDRAAKALYSISGAFSNGLSDSIPLCLTLFDTLIKPILIYASDFWGMFPVALNLTSPFEQMHMSFCKRLLKLQKKTTTAAIYFELNRIPLHVSAQINALNNFLRIANHSGNELVTKAFVYSLENSLFWTESIKKALEINDLQHVFFNAHVIKPKTSIVSSLKNRLVDSFQKSAMDKMKHPTSKLRTYSAFAQKNKTPDYLCSTVNTRKRKLFTRLRLSNHDLMIEKGRPLKLKVHERTCPLCNNGLEDEIHFTILCPALACTREKFFSEVTETLPTFTNLCDHDKFVHIINPIPSIAAKAASYIALITEERQKLIELYVKNYLTTQLSIHPTEEQLKHPLRTYILLKYV